MAKKIVKTGLFCVVTDSEYAYLGVKKGDTVYIAGEGHVPVTENDPYLYRLIFVAARIIEGEVQTNEGGFTIDAKRLKPVSDVRQAKLQKRFEERFEQGV